MKRRKHIDSYSRSRHGRSHTGGKVSAHDKSVDVVDISAKVTRKEPLNDAEMEELLADWFDSMDEALVWPEANEIYPFGNHDIKVLKVDYDKAEQQWAYSLEVDEVAVDCFRDKRGFVMLKEALLPAYTEEPSTYPE